MKAALIKSGGEICRAYKSEKDFVEAFEGVEDLPIDAFEIPLQRVKNEEKQKDTYSEKNFIF